MSGECNLRKYPAHFHGIDLNKTHLLCSYTWKIYANKMLNMGCIYTFWKQLNKEQKQAKQRYIQMFYSLQLRNTVLPLFSSPLLLYEACYKISCPSENEVLEFMFYVTDEDCSPQN